MCITKQIDNVTSSNFDGASQGGQKCKRRGFKLQMIGSANVRGTTVIKSVIQCRYVHVYGRRSY